jgi:CheY-like chemotaxis protein
MELKKQLILIADDNPENIKVLGNLLTSNAYDVGAVPNGEKVFEFLEQEVPDLILLDVLMPGMDGFEVCEKLKSMKKTRHIPIIFLTARNSTDDIVRGLQLGGVDYISKPFNQAELLARVSVHIEIKNLRGLLPICSSCHSIRNDKGYWDSLEKYIENRSQIIFSYGLCIECADQIYGDMEWYTRAKKRNAMNDEQKEQSKIVSP